MAVVPLLFLHRKIAPVDRRLLATNIIYDGHIIMISEIIIQQRRRINLLPLLDKKFVPRPLVAPTLLITVVKLHVVVCVGIHTLW